MVMVIIMGYTVGPVGMSVIVSGTVSMTEALRSRSLIIKDKEYNSTEQNRTGKKREVNKTQSYVQN